MKNFIEKLPSPGRADISVPLCFLACYDRVIIFDHLRDAVFISSTGLPVETEHLRGLRAKARAEELSRTLSTRSISAPRTAHLTSPQGAGEVVSNFTRDDYLRAVVRAKEYIAAGDIYQVNLSQRFSARVHTPPLQLYKTLRGLSPAPFAAFLDCGDATLISSSPKRFLRMTGRTVETRPIKGTRPRSRDKAEDDRLKAELLSSPKDRAELMMSKEVRPCGSNVAACRRSAREAFRACNFRRDDCSNQLASCCSMRKKCRGKVARVTRTYQYARWIDGSTYLWMGRRKQPGRGEGSSGLQFDSVQSSGG